MAQGESNTDLERHDQKDDIFGKRFVSHEFCYLRVNSIQRTEMLSMEHEAKAQKGAEESHLQ